EDIPLLIEEFVETLSAQHGFKPLSFTPEAQALLMSHPWPGNVRELKNFVERMLIIHGGRDVGPLQLPPDFLGESAQVAAAATAHSPAFSPGAVNFKHARSRFEAEFLQAKLREFGGNVTRLAEAVGLERSSLYRKLKAYHIQVSE
ncbi:MAG: helix-turn-helix domain-containing protein, partial [Desulfovibrionaceae bacterium]